MLILTATLLLAPAGAAPAAELSATADRTRIKLGEDVRITVKLRGAPGRPEVIPPDVPGCRIEQTGATTVRSFGSGGLGMPPAARGSSPRVNDALEQLTRQMEKQLQDLPKDLSREGFGDLALFAEHAELLRSIRQDAMRALNGPSSVAQEFQATFKVTPERAGILTLPGFTVKTGAQTATTKPIEITIEAPPPAAPPPAAPRATPKPPPPASPAAPAPPKAAAPLALPALYEPATLFGQSWLPADLWPWLAALLAVPPAAWLSASAWQRWRRRRLETAPQRRRRQALRTARRLLGRGDDAGAVAQALSRYLQMKCDLPDGELTPAETGRLLAERGVSGDLADRYAGLMETCAAARFTAGGIAVAEGVRADARRLLTDVEKAARW